MRIIALANIAFCLTLSSVTAHSPSAEVPKDPARYMAKARRAAPDALVDQATYAMRQPDGSFKEMQQGTNGFTCLVMPDGTPACADAGRMEWIKAVLSGGPAPESSGIVYMMAGDTGTTNHDPKARESHEHWVQTGPHVMMVRKAARELAALYPHALDPDPTQPYVMYPDPPYQHLMVPSDDRKGPRELTGREPP